MLDMAAKKTAKKSTRHKRKPVVLVPDRKERVPIFDEPAKKAGIDVIYGGKSTPGEIAKLCAKVDPDCVLTWRKPVNAKAIAGMRRCKHIIREGIGYDVVDVDAASAKGIFVSNVPSYCVDEVSTHAMTLMLALIRDLLFHHGEMTSKGFNEYWDGKPMPPTDQLTLGLVAFGKIARAAAVKAQGFGMEVISYDPYLYDDIFEGYRVMRCYQLRELLAQADIVSVHTPLTPETELMFGDKEFAQMKKGSYFINTSRGKVVDLDAVNRALDKKILAGAGIDVFQREPLETDHPLLNRREVIATAHLGYASERSMALVKEEAIADAIRVIQGDRPLYLVNPEVYANLKK